MLEIPSAYQVLQDQRKVETLVRNDVTASNAYSMALEYVVRSIKDAANIPDNGGCYISLIEYDALIAKYILQDLIAKGYTLIVVGTTGYQWKVKWRNN